MSTSKGTGTVELNDGALYGLAQGAKMDIKSSIIEFVDNAEDANASMVSIIIDDENNTLTVCSKEDTDLEAMVQACYLAQCGMTIPNWRTLIQTEFL